MSKRDLHEGSLSLTAKKDPKELFDSVDTDGNGAISLAEFRLLHSKIVTEERKLVEDERKAAEEASMQRRSTTYYKKVATALTLCILLVIGVNAAMTAAVVFLSKDVSTKDGALVDASTGTVVTTGEATTAQSLDSRLPDTVWHEIKYLEFTSAAGGYLHLSVTATVRKPDDEALYGSIVTMYTSLGHIELDGEIVTFHESMVGVFSAAGFEVAAERRRLSSAFVLIGLFNSVPEFENWNTTYDSSPKIATTYHADIEYLYPCMQKHPNTGVWTDLCDEYGVPDEFIVDENGTDRDTIVLNSASYELDVIDTSLTTLYARVDSELWADAASAKQRESFANMANLVGWTLDRVTSALGDANFLDVAQTWQSTGERFFCRTVPGPTQLTFEDDVWVAAYLGEVVHNDTDAVKFRIKHRETNNVSVEYITSFPEEIDGTLYVTPLQIRANLSDADHTADSIQSFIINFKTFEVLSSVDASVFSWGLDDSFTNHTACSTTLNMTMPYDDDGLEIGGDGEIPREFKIEGANPFVPYLLAPDSTQFFHAMRASPSSTAAEIFAAVEAGTLVFNDTDDLEDDAITAGRMSIEMYEEEQARLEGGNYTYNGSAPDPFTVDEEQTLDVYYDDGNQRRQLSETTELDFPNGARERRQLEHAPGFCDGTGAIDVGTSTDSNCPDTCVLWPPLPFIPGFDPPCDIEISRPHACSMEFSCGVPDGPVKGPSWDAVEFQAGPMTIQLSASIFLDCTHDFSTCSGGGCLQMDAGLGKKGIFWSFGYIQACLYIRGNFRCGHCKKVETVKYQRCESYKKWYWRRGRLRWKRKKR